MPTVLRRHCFAVLLAAVLLTSLRATVAATPILTITGIKIASISLTQNDLATMPRLSVRATDKDGKIHAYEGVVFSEVLKRAGAPLGRALHGEALKLCVLARAADGYSAVFSLAELDAEMTDKIVLLADRCDGSAMAEGVGPLRVIVPDEKRHARWMRGLVSLELVRVDGAQSVGKISP